ncbi:CD151 antigen [Onthophagus taurus]|uniref:CD151 antigen n=1 Tax=Onthophagus taurus TaxID=166361 RepID=UPI000C201559|nr:CD151 antigen-like [Onthophagus taurus]
MGYAQLDGCGNCVKYAMFVTNLIIFLGGLVLVALGIWSITDKAFANQLLGTNLYSGSIYIMLTMGIIVCFISFLGYFGSIKEIRCLLVAYFICVFLIFVTMLIGGILGYVFRGKIETTLENAMLASLKHYGNNRAVTDAWDETQTRLQCCGVNSYRDWDFKTPDTCCRETAPGVRQSCQDVTQHSPIIMYTNGCLNITKKLVKEHAVIIGSAGIIVACILILGMIFSCALYKKIDE